MCLELQYHSTYSTESFFSSSIITLTVSKLCQRKDQDKSKFTGCIFYATGAAHHSTGMLTHINTKLYKPPNPTPKAQDFPRKAMCKQACLLARRPT